MGDLMKKIINKISIFVATVFLTCSLQDGLMAMQQQPDAKVQDSKNIENKLSSSQVVTDFEQKANIVIDRRFNDLKNKNQSKYGLLMDIENIIKVIDQQPLEDATFNVLKAKFYELLEKVLNNQKNIECAQGIIEMVLKNEDNAVIKAAFEQMQANFAVALMKLKVDANAQQLKEEFLEKFKVILEKNKELNNHRELSKNEQQDQKPVTTKVGSSAYVFPVLSILPTCASIGLIGGGVAFDSSMAAGVGVVSLPISAVIALAYGAYKMKQKYCSKPKSA